MLVSGMYLADRYEIIEKIGSGGMADVYKAKDTKLNRYVAIKVLKNEYSTDANFVRKFRVEAQSAAGLSHPNIVSVYDVGEDSGVHYIVMELIQGITLKNYIDMKGKLEIKEALNISIQIASGLSAAHENRIIHRDIKPQNIIMSRDGKVKVTDFGIAKVADSTTVTTTAAGSVHYISPEQARGGYSDAKSDIYSLGITMYEMLTGKVPFDGETNVAVALLHIQGDMVPPRQVEPSIPKSYEKIILKCTQKKPERRYSSAKELIADLRRVLSNPDGEYVVMSGMKAADSRTVVISEQDVAKTRVATRNTEQAEAAYKRQQQEELRRRQQQEELRRRKQQEALRAVEEESFEDEEEDDEKSNVSKILMILGIVGAAVLVIAVCVILVKAIGLVGGAAKDPKESESETKIETELETKAKSETMISVIGLSREEAQKALDAAHITATFEERAGDAVPGTVLDQNPASGTKITKDTKVIIYVCVGANTFKLQDYKGLDLESARSLIAAANLRVADVEYEENDDYGENEVIRTSPVGGTDVHEGDAITLYVSKGAESSRVPTLIGLTEAEAKAAVQNAGLTWGGSSVDNDSTAPKGTVSHFAVDNDWEAYTGQKVKKGAVVIVTVSAGPKETESKETEETVSGPVSNTVTLDPRLTGQAGELVVQMANTGTIIYTNAAYDSNTFEPAERTIRGEAGTTDTILYYLDGNLVYSESITFR